MTQTVTSVRVDVPSPSRRRRLRLWIAMIAATLIVAAVVVKLLPLTYAAPVIGLVLALGAPPDHVAEARPVARRPRNVWLGAGSVVALAVTVGQPHLTLPIVALFGRSVPDTVVSLVAATAMALPLAMVDAPAGVRPAGRFMLTRRNLIGSLTVMVSVAAWYSSLGYSFLPIAIFVVGLPLLIGVSRVVAARRGRVEYALLRHPARPELAPHRLQLANVGLFCLVASLTVPTGAYEAVAVQLPGVYSVLLVLFFVGLAVLVLLALLPLRRVRVGSNLLVAAGTVFLATQLIMLYRPPVDAVTIGSPLAQEWWVAHGGRAELVNYHHNGPMQSNALDIMQLGAGGTHQPGSTDLTSYHIYNQPVLAPADGTVTFVVDGRPDQPIGSIDERHPSGNQVVVDLGGNRFLLMAHLRQGSVSVRVGDRVRAGQEIARVGNSGDTTAPHIHLQAQTLPTGIDDLSTVDLPQMLATLHTYPLLIRDASLIRRGAATQPSLIDPRRGDLVRPTDASPQE